MEPHLIDARRPGARIRLAVHNAAAGRHGLYVAHAQQSLCAGCVLVHNLAFADIGDDLKFSVSVHRETGLRCDPGVGKNPHGAKTVYRCSRILW